MDAVEKVNVLGEAARYDLCGEACGTESTRVRDDIGRWIYPAVMPDGKRIAMLKILQSNICKNDCYYCAQRASRDSGRRITFEPEELAGLFDKLHRARLVHGLFLSSAICGGNHRSMERMIDTVEIVRGRYAFKGYVHLKILPGVQQAAIERAVQLADRVSINLEAPSADHLAKLCGSKAYIDDLGTRLRWTAEALEAARHGPRPKVGGGRAGLTTQFVVGAAGESDQGLLRLSAGLYRQLNLRRAYFSAFQPVRDTPLEDQSPTPLWREHRLYQSDWLLRFYGFSFSDFVFDDQGNLPREGDPKLMWARAHPERFPIEVNRAPRHELLRVPGIGPRSASRILNARRQSALRELSDLSKLGAVAKRAAPYVLLNGRRPPFQLSIW
jgi:putative DNA modification/repair radical SAM protein